MTVARLSGPPLSTGSQGAALADRPSVGLQPRPYAQEVVALLKSRWQAIIVFGLLLIAVDLIRGWSVDPSRSLPNFLYEKNTLFYYEIWAAAATGIAPAFGHALRVRNWLSALVTGAITVALVTAVVALCFALQEAPSPIQDYIIVSKSAFAVRTCWFFSAAGLLFGAYCAARDRQAQAARAAQSATLELANMQRQVIESRLTVLQAQVEPEFLFGSLEVIRALYRQSPTVAEGVLGELILYLRAALPQMRSDTSTIGREAELVRSYLTVLVAPFVDPPIVASEIDAKAVDRRFPPMVLLPLAQAAAEGLASRRRITVRAVLVDPMTELTLTIDGGAAPQNWNEPVLTSMRETIVAVCGSRSTIESSSSGDTHQARIRVPAS